MSIGTGLLWGFFLVWLHRTCIIFDAMMKMAVEGRSDGNAARAFVEFEEVTRSGRLISTCVRAASQHY